MLAPVRLALQSSHGRRSYAAAALAVAGATGAMLLVRDAFGVLNVLLVFLLLCFVLALTEGSGPAAVAALLSFLSFDFFFIPPLYTFTVARRDHVLALFVYLAIAIVTGQLVARVRARTEVAEREQRRTTLLYELNAALVEDVTLDAILATIVERVVRVYGAERCRILLPGDDGALRVRARFPATMPDAIDRQHLAIAGWVMEHGQPAGQRAAGRRLRPPHGVARRPGPPPRHPGPDVLYLPIATPRRVVGVLEVGGRPGGGRFGEEDAARLTSFANQAALALERARLTEEAASAAVFAQSDELKSALLAAVSHDLRTPLATIKASATSLLDPTVTWDEEARAEFLHAIDEEADRLNLLVGNLLDLSRIEGGALRPDKEWYDVAELVADVANRLAPRAARHRLAAEVQPDLPLVRFDYVEIAQVLTNLVENALKYTPIAAHTLPRLFEKFYRAKADGRVPGSGIGLAICKGLVEAHGGRIWAESRVGEGTAFRFTLPLDQPPGRAPDEP